VGKIKLNNSNININTNKSPRENIKIQNVKGKIHSNLDEDKQKNKIIVNLSTPKQLLNEPKIMHLNIFGKQVAGGITKFVNLDLSPRNYNKQTTIMESQNRNNFKESQRVTMERCKSAKTFETNNKLIKGYSNLNKYTGIPTVNTSLYDKSINQTIRFSSHNREKALQSARSLSKMKNIISTNNDSLIDDNKSECSDYNINLASIKQKLNDIKYNLSFIQPGRNLRSMPPIRINYRSCSKEKLLKVEVKYDLSDEDNNIRQASVIQTEPHIYNNEIKIDAISNHSINFNNNPTRFLNFVRMKNKERCIANKQ
jgi:hypothetical protein